MNRKTLYVVGGGVAVLGLLGLALAATASADNGLPDVDDDDAGGLDLKKPKKPPAVIKRPTPPRMPGEPADVPPRQPVGPAPVDVTKIENDYPTPWKYLQVKKNDMFFGTNAKRSIAYRYLLSAAYIAAKDNGASDEAARAFAKTIAKTGDGAAQRRTAALNLILCHAGNDQRYGTFKVPGNQHPGPHGRTILLLPRYKNNRVAMSQGGPLERTIGLQGGNFWVTDGQHRAYPYLMMPGMDLNALWLQRQVRPSQKTWADGSRGMHDPAAVSALDVTLFENDDVQGVEFGCLGGQYVPF